ncbi:uncharacterized protein FIBRA_08856 [Fibroporia radiculosa]|uniref:BTB domain-containing protein n=1 Tax=Fibroporia radiculosa TaxID=599839 RepID=J4GID8_9APHY|nr:uncharacterized protein FIBRA_08856 [Fibroporia radiculosa]CCM06578.1 predicted protein [Fibroporia radiculosa]
MSSNDSGKSSALYVDVSSSAVPCSDLQPDKEFWFEDGNIVLGVETTAFRVHRSLLSRSSDVFRDMFDIPQPENVDVWRMSIRTPSI